MPIAAGETVLGMEGSFGEFPTNVCVRVNGATIFNGIPEDGLHVLFSSLRRWRICLAPAYTANLEGQLTVSFPEPHDGPWYVSFECA